MKHSALPITIGTAVQQFEQLYQENLDRMYRFVYSHVRNREAAEDLTSQIFLKAVRSLDLELSGHSGTAWLFRAARTTIADYWRAHYRQATTYSLEALVEAGWEGSNDADPPLEKCEVAECVEEILQALPERYREVLTCRFLLQLSLRETAVSMGVTEANVKVMQYRALRRAANSSMHGLLGPGVGLAARPVESVVQPKSSSASPHP
jgi:RNA polymerase sigma-70 factor, ECF subfamily